MIVWDPCGDQTAQTRGAVDGIGGSLYCRYHNDYLLLPKLPGAKPEYWAVHPTEEELTTKYLPLDDA